MTNNDNKNLFINGLFFIFHLCHSDVKIIIFLEFSKLFFQKKHKLYISNKV